MICVSLWSMIKERDSRSARDIVVILRGGTGLIGWHEGRTRTHNYRVSGVVV